MLTLWREVSNSPPLDVILVQVCWQMNWCTYWWGAQPIKVLRHRLIYLYPQVLLWYVTDSMLNICTVTECVDVPKLMSCCYWRGPVGWFIWLFRNHGCRVLHSVKRVTASVAGMLYLSSVLHVWDWHFLGSYNSGIWRALFLDAVCGLMSPFRQVDIFSGILSSACTFYNGNACVPCGFDSGEQSCRAFVARGASLLCIHGYGMQWVLENCSAAAVFEHDHFLPRIR